MTRREYANIFEVYYSIPDPNKEIDRDFVLFIESCRKVFAEIERMKNSDEENRQFEPLTDSEQRIFLTAMFKEEKICEKVDKAVVREAYEDTLVGMCHEIKRKVKAALWR